jgi:hypothetical protein
MGLCPVCFLFFSDLGEFQGHVELCHNDIFDARTNFFTMRYNWYDGIYRVYERKLDATEMMRLSSFDELRDLLKHELPAVIGALRFPNFINIKIDMQMKKPDSDTGLMNFVDIGLQSKKFELKSLEFSDGLIDRIIEDLNVKFDLRTNLASGLTLNHFFSIQVAACVKVAKKAFGCVNDNERDLPQWIRREILPTSNPSQPIVDNEKCFIRGLNACLDRNKPLNNRDFYNENYVDLPETYPVDVKTMIKFAEANDIDMHLCLCTY